jgi:hypothetical protein
MRRIAFLVVVIGLGSAGLLWGSPEKEAGGRTGTKSFEEHRFSAASVQVRNGRLTVTDLKPIDKETTNRQQAGRVLIRCSPHVALALWTAQVGNEMARATPLLGREKLGATALPFKSPGRITLIYLNRAGCTMRKQTVMIKEVEVR